MTFLMTFLRKLIERRRNSQNNIDTIMTNTYTEQNNSQSKNFITITLRLQLVIPTNSKDGRATDAHTNQFTSRRRGGVCISRQIHVRRGSKKVAQSVKEHLLQPSTCHVLPLMVEKPDIVLDVLPRPPERLHCANVYRICRSSFLRSKSLAHCTCHAIQSASHIDTLCQRSNVAVHFQHRRMIRFFTD
jgi:hypothetical protein